MTALPSIIAGAGADVVATGNFEAVSPAGMYGRKPSTSTGRVFGYFGGIYAPGIVIADGTVTAAASTTSYVVVNRTTGAVSISTSPTDWNDAVGFFRMRLLMADASNILNGSGRGEDYRPSVYASGSGGGGGGTVTSVGFSWSAALSDILTMGGSPVTTSGTLTADAVDPGADRLLFWDDSASKITYLTLGANLSITGTTLNASGGGGGSSSFIGLTDVPASYSGSRGLPVMVNPGETALQFLGAPNGVSSSFTLAAADAVRTTRVTAAATVTVPPNSSVAFPVGTLIPIRQTSSGTVTIAAGVGVTVNPPFQGSLLGAGAGALLVLEKVGTNEWDLSGDTARSASGVTLLTPIAATSGATIDYTGLPSTIREITMHYSGVSLSGSEAPLVQLGDSGGIENTGYSGGFVQSAAGGAVAIAGSTAGAQMGSLFPSGTSTVSGHVTFKLVDPSTNTWTWSGNLYDAVATRAYAVAGTKSLSATLDRVRFAATGAATYDGGTVNVSYQ